MTTVNDVTTLIPQRSPILMVDSYSYIDDANAVSSLAVRPDCLLAEGGALVPEAVLEHIAQTAAAHAGYTRMQAGKPVCLGYIGDMRKVSFDTAAKVGDRLETTLNVVSEFGNILLVTATVRVEGNSAPVCQCRMKLSMAG